MLKKPNKKIFLLLSLFIIIGFLGFKLFEQQQVKTAQARVGDRSQPQLFGWAWTQTIGWISMNCFSENNDNYCDAGHDYGISVDQDSGKLKGYAWSNNIGWINFGDTNSGSIINYPGKGSADDPTKNCDQTNCIDGSCSACYNFKKHHLYGWAQIVSLGDDGWIRLDNPQKTQTWGIVEDNDVDNGDFSGWAWNGNTVPKVGIGWMSWNSDNETTGPAYKVDGNPRKLAITSVQRTKGEESHSLTIVWNGDVYGETKFYILRKPNNTREGDLDTSDEELVRYIDYDLEKEGLDNLEVVMAQDATTYNDGSHFPRNRLKKELDMDTAYTYRIKACNMFGCTISSTQTKKTSPISAVQELKINTTCDKDQASFILQWRNPISRVLLDYFEAEYCVATAGKTVKDCTESDWQHAFYYTHPAQPFQQLEVRQYTDQMSAARFNADKYNNHFYRIRAVHNKSGKTGPPTDDECEDGDGCDDIGSWAYTERAVRPCVPPTQPQYKEVRPE